MGFNLEHMLSALAGLPAARMLPEMLSMLRRETCAGAALLIRDTPAGPIPWVDALDPSILNGLTVNCGWRKAISAGELVLSAYPADHLEQPALDRWGARALAILPVHAQPAFTGAAVVLWRKPVDNDYQVCSFLRSVMLLLNATIPFTEALRQASGERDWVEAMLESLPQGIAFLDDAHERAWVNQEAARILDLPSGTAVPWLLQAAVERLRGSAEPASRAWTAVLDSADRRVLSVSSRRATVLGVTGQLWVFTDTTAERRMEDELRESEHRYRELFENSPLPAWVYEVSTLAILAVNEAAVQHYGYSREQFLSMTLRDLRPEEEVPKLLAGLGDVQKTHQTSGPWIHRKHDGSLALVEVSSHEVRFSGRQARLVMINDITERSVAERQLREQEERWQLALRGNNDGLWDYDMRRDEVFFSRRWKEMLGYTEDELSNHTREWELRVHPDDFPGVQAKLHDHLTRKSLYYAAEYRLRCKDGSYKWVLARGQAIWDENGLPVRMVGSHSDITERKLSEEQLTREALYDSLTGLLNRRALFEALERAVQRAKEHGVPLSLAVGDLDQFKSINDTYGHPAGDEVLSAFGRIAQQFQQAGDLTGRIGGDEFCMVFPHGTLAHAEAVLERTRSAMATLKFHGADGKSFTVNVTFGVCAWHPGMGSKDLVEAADRKLYHAKEMGRHKQPAPVF